MVKHYLLWASGHDRPGIVAMVTETLFKLGGNLEDSSMMRLGSEFAIFLIFSSEQDHPQSRLDKAFTALRQRHRLSIGVKPISRSQARFHPSARRSFLVSVHGHDRPGIVYRVTQALARRKFNITDLSTHRTMSRGSAGYILFIEGELESTHALSTLQADLARLARRMKTRIGIRAIEAESL